MNRRKISFIAWGIVIAGILFIGNYFFCFTNYNHDCTYEESKDYKSAYKLYNDYMKNEYTKTDIINKMGAPYFWNEKAKRWDKKTNYMNESYWLYPNLMVESYFDYAESEYYNLEIYFDEENKVKKITFQIGC